MPSGNRTTKVTAQTFVKKYISKYAAPTSFNLKIFCKPRYVKLYVQQHYYYALGFILISPANKSSEFASGYNSMLRPAAFTATRPPDGASP